jgi:2-polyprenyl-6-methoxyphenol hydroxylase-like FAD-dependent oxidoreductase
VKEPGGRAIVIGAGVGGLAAGVALRAAGWDVTVLERRPADRGAGSGISLWPNALRALAALGVDDLVTAGATLGGRSTVRTPRGAAVAHSDIGAAIVERHGLPLVLVRREVLVSALRDKLGPERIRFDTEVVEVTTDGGGAVVVTATGSYPGDLVVAADGARSRIREQLFPGQAALRYAGYTTWRMLAARPGGDGESSETWGSGGRRFAILPLGDRLYCYATAAGEPGPAADDDRDRLRERFGDWHGPIPEIIDGLGPADVIRADVFAFQTPLAAYHRGRVVLLGDAAHAMTPDLGQGGCQALEDAVVLGALIAAGTTLESSLQRYSALRAPRGADLIRRSRSAGRIYQAPVPLARAGARLAGLLPARLTVRALDPVLAWQPGL